MFENIEIRRVTNGYILLVHTEEDSKEFIYDSERKLIQAIKSYLDKK